MKTLIKIFSVVTVGLFFAFSVVAQGANFSEVRFKISPPKQRFEIQGEAPASVTRLLELVQNITIPAICVPPAGSLNCSFSLNDVTGPSNDFSINWVCPASFAPCELKMNSQTIGQVSGTGKSFLNLDKIVQRAPIFSLANARGGICGTGIAHTYNTGTTASQPTGAAPAVLVLTQSAYRWFDNADSLTPGSALAGLNTAPTIAPGANARLRLMIDVSGASLSAGAQNFRLQVASKDVTCAASSYASIADTAFQWSDNAGVADGATISLIANDPTHSGHTRVVQRYVESLPFTSGTAIPAGQDGLWDFSLVHTGANGDYCFRVSDNDSAAIDAYDVYAEISVVAGT